MPCTTAGQIQLGRQFPGGAVQREPVEGALQRQLTRVPLRGRPQRLWPRPGRLIPARGLRPVCGCVHSFQPGPLLSKPFLWCVHFMPTAVYQRTEANAQSLDPSMDHFSHSATLLTCHNALWTDHTGLGSCGRKASRWKHCWIAVSYFADCSQRTRRRPRA